MLRHPCATRTGYTLSGKSLNHHISHSNATQKLPDLVVQILPNRHLLLQTTRNRYLSHAARP